MDNSILKKRLNTYRSKGGHIRNLPDDLMLSILRAWEQWPGSAKDYYISLGSTYKQMAKIMGKAKRLVREGRVLEDGEFQELAMEAGVVVSGSNDVKEVSCQGIELVWDAGRVIRFSRVDELVDFIKKAA